jgi:hypothetical protein
MSFNRSASGLLPNANFPTVGMRANTSVRPYGVIMAPASIFADTCWGQLLRIAELNREGFAKFATVCTVKQ